MIIIDRYLSITSSVVNRRSTMIMCYLFVVNTLKVRERGNVGGREREKREEAREAWERERQTDSEREILRERFWERKRERERERKPEKQRERERDSRRDRKKKGVLRNRCVRGTSWHANFACLIIRYPFRYMLVQLSGQHFRDSLGEKQTQKERHREISEWEKMRGKEKKRRGERET